MDNTINKQYPLGQFELPAEITDQDLDHFIRAIRDFPDKLAHLVEDWNDEQLDTQYRESGWKVRQVINHLSDISMAAYLRFKRALTEDNPTIIPFDQQMWAELQDSFSIGIEPALRILKGVHERWAYELNSLTNKEFESTYYHPLRERAVSLRECLSYCAWHCEHHFAHIENLKKEKGW